MSFSAEDTRLMFNGVTVYEAPGPVVIEHEFNDKALILYWPGRLYDSGPGNRYKSLESEELWEQVSRNVLMVDKDGNVEWRIANFNYKNRPNFYYRIAQDDQGWFATTSDDYLKKIDMETGEVLESSLSR